MRATHSHSGGSADLASAASRRRWGAQVAITL